MGSNVTPELLPPGAAEFPLPWHANFPCIMPEIAENATAADIDVILKHRVANVAEVGNGNIVADDAAFNLYSVANAAVVPYARFAAQISVGTYGAMPTNAHVPFNDTACLDDGALAQLKHA